MNRLLRALLLMTGSLLLQHLAARVDPALLKGRWLLSFNSEDIGLVRTLMTFEADSAHFSAHSRKGATRDLMGAGTSGLARLFSGSFKGGALLHIVNGKTEQRGDSLILSGIFTSALGNYYFNGSVHKGLLTAQLRNRKKVLRGWLSGTREVPSVPLAGYPALVEKAMAVTRDRIYDREVTAAKAFRKFEKHMKRTAAKTQDDLELVFAFFYRARSLPFSHYALMRPLPGAQDQGMEQSPEPCVHLEEKSPGVAYMKISSFGGSAREMDSVFSIVKRKSYSQLIVDLRNNHGGSVAAGLKFASNIADSSFYGGVFLTQKWFARHSSPPDIKDYPGLKHFTEASYDLIIEGVHNEEGLCLKVIPDPQPYKGKVFILTDRITASTCEPIVYGLRQHRLATIVGERTAGAMLNGETFPVQDGFSVVVPTAYYYASDGYRIDRKGVEPDIRVESSKALDYTLQNLINKTKQP